VKALLATLRPARAPAIVVVAYLIVRAVFDGLTEHGGLISPSGDVSPGVALLGLLVLVLRIVVLFVVPAVLTYRLVARVLDRTRSAPP
jgi:hypothetical protein